MDLTTTAVVAAEANAGDDTLVACGKGRAAAAAAEEIVAGLAAADTYPAVAGGPDVVERAWMTSPGDGVETSAAADEGVAAGDDRAAGVNGVAVDSTHSVACMSPVPGYGAGPV